MLSSYRLGDCFVNILNADEIKELIREHPGTLGANYCKSKKEKGIQTMTGLVMQLIPRLQTRFPVDIGQSLVIHLRLGDVVAGTEDHEKSKRPLELQELKKKIVGDYSTIYVIGKCFFAKPSSTNYEECKTKSQEYLQQVKDELGAVYFDGGHADIDLCCAVLAAQFIQGRGFYSSLITKIRECIGKPFIGTTVCV